MGRIDSADVFKDVKALYPAGYIFSVQSDGHWSLFTCVYKHPQRQLAEGSVRLDSTRWHKMQVRFVGERIQAAIDGVEVAAVNDKSHDHGMIGIGSGWDHTAFDDLLVDPLK